MDYTFTIEGLAEFKEAIKRNPQVVKEEVGKFLVRAKSKYLSTILNNPWRVGMSGGGAPVATGNLRDTHESPVSTWEMSIFPTSPYAKYIHGTGGARKGNYPLRPWLDYAFKTNEKGVQNLEGEMVDTIIEKLVK
ncbi:MAG: hypothetical protein WC499_02470 [Patescibacteria group bacterium]